MIKVLFVGGECDPFIKTGGLADVLASLPKNLINKGIDARVMIPKYGAIKEEYKNLMNKVAEFTVDVGWRKQYCGIEVLEYQGVTYYFVDNEYYFKRDGIYGFYDDGERFAFFSRAVLEALPRMDFVPDILHLNDWHCGPISVLLKEEYGYREKYSKIKTIFTIHNLRYQGVFPKSCLGELFGLSEELFTPDKLEFYGSINFMKWGIVYSDIVSTVSDTYSEEIQNKYFGEKLEDILGAKKHSLYGIINGIDYEIYNPISDPYIEVNYSKEEKKAVENKLKLQEILNLEKNEDIPIICVISRLVSEKGLDLVKEVFDEILSQRVQVVILGTGDKSYEEYFKSKAQEYKNLSANIRFDNALAHKIYCGSDFILMPSIYEPCGLSQLIALAYGTVPIVRETGGLKDTIESFNEFTNEGNGFSFKAINAQDMLFTIKRALKIYEDKEKFQVLVENAIKSDYSWDKSCEKYIDLYKKLI